MKTICLTFMIMLITISSTAQRWSQEWEMNYAYTAPLGSMNYNIRGGNGLTMNFGMLNPSKRLSLGMELNYTQYGRDKSRQLYDLDDGTTAKMDVIVANSFVNFMLDGRYYPIAEGNFLLYLSAKGGWSAFYTDLNIYDPDDWDHCEPVDSDMLQHDGTLIASLGAGFRLDLSTLMKKLPSNILYLNFSATATQGGTVEYMNTDAPKHASTNSTDVMANFRNTQTQVMHKHHVGYLYSSPVQMADFRLGVMFRLNR